MPSRPWRQLLGGLSYLGLCPCLCLCLYGVAVGRMYEKMEHDNPYVLASMLSNEYCQYYGTRDRQVLITYLLVGAWPLSLLVGESRGVRCCLSRHVLE